MIVFSVRGKGRHEFILGIDSHVGVCGCKLAVGICYVFIRTAFHESDFIPARIASCRSPARYIRFHASWREWLDQHNDPLYEYIIALDVIAHKELYERNRGGERFFHCYWEWKRNRVPFIEWHREEKAKFEVWKQWYTSTNVVPIVLR